MTWKELVSYLKEPRVMNGPHHGAPPVTTRRSTPGGSGSDGDDGSLSTSCSFEEPSPRKRFSFSPPSHWVAERGTDDVTVISLGGSSESLMELSPSSPKPRLVRTGSIRVCESPLHRGSILGSPAFRRKKMRTRSEANLHTTSSNATASPKPSALPVPAAAPKRTSSTGVTMRNKSKMVRGSATGGSIANARLLGSSGISNSQSPSGSPRGSLHGSPANSPRNSVYGTLQRATVEHRKTKLTRSESCRSKSSSPVIAAVPAASPAITNANRTMSLQRKSAARNSSASPSRTSPQNKAVPVQSPLASASPKQSPPVATSTPLSSKMTAASSKSRIPNPKNAALTSGGGSKKSNSSSPSSSISSSSGNIKAAGSKNNTAATAKSNHAKQPKSSSPPNSPNNNAQNGASSSSSSSSSSAHRPGHLPSYLNKSSPSLNANSMRRSLGSKLPRSRPVSRDFDNHGKSQLAAASVSNLKSSSENNGLAPTAKFRSDGEISICSEEKTLSTAVKQKAVAQKRGIRTEEHIYESVDLAEAQKLKTQTNAPPFRPPRAAAAAKNSYSANSRALHRCGETDLRNSEELRLSSEVQCWPPWGSNAATAAGQRQDTQLKGQQLRIKESAVSKAAATGGKNKCKSASLDTRLEPQISSFLSHSKEGTVRQNFLKVRSRSLGFFQRLGGLRRSFSNRGNGRIPLTQQRRLPQQLPHAGDHVFFRGFSGKTPEELHVEPYAVCHGPSLAVPSPLQLPQAPPRRRRPKRCLQEDEEEFKPLRRSLSFTDAHFIAQAVYEGDTRLIEELYPDFPRSEPIYAVVDRSKKLKNRRQRPSTFHDEVAAESAAIVRLTPIQAGATESEASSNESSAAAATERKSSSQDNHCANSVILTTTSEVNSSCSAADQVATMLARARQRNNEGGEDEASRRRRAAANVGQSSERRGRGQNSKRASNNQRRQLSQSENKDDVTFSSSVMFVRQTDNHNRHDHHLPDLIHDSTPPPSQHYNYHATPSRRTVTKVNVEHNKGASLMDQLKEASPVISPWNTGRPRPGSTSSNESSSNGGNVSPNNSVLFDCDGHQLAGNGDIMPWAASVPQQTTTVASAAAIHPFAHRTQLHYLQRHQERMREQSALADAENDVSITTSRNGGVTLSPNSLNAATELCIQQRSNPRLLDNRTNRYHYHRSESADRILDHQEHHNRVNVASHYQHKKHSAPARVSTMGERQLHIEDIENGNSADNANNKAGSFKRILAKADNNLCQAESILSSLQIEQQQQQQQQQQRHGLVLDDTESESEHNSLGSDIETNIRRLEKTQAKINAALETFRTVQAMSGPEEKIGKTFRMQRHDVNSCLDESGQQMAFNSLPPAAVPLQHRHPHHRHHQVLGQTRYGNSRLKEETTAKSKTAPGKLEGGAAAAATGKHQGFPDTSPSTTSSSSSSNLNNNNGNSATGTRPKKTSLFRRHSFSLVGNKEKSPAPSVDSYTTSSTSQRESSLWYEGDLDSDAPMAAVNRSSAVYEDGYSFSDSEGGFMPLRNRLKGLLGSFGKGKKRRYAGKKNKGVVTSEIAAAETMKKQQQHEGQASPILKATLGEFTRQIESLSARRESGDDITSLTLSRQTSLPASTSYYSAHQSSSGTGSSTSHHSHSQDFAARAAGPAVGGHVSRKDALMKVDSNDTYASASSFNPNSNRNSVISGQSVSSESYENEEPASEDERRRRRRAQLEEEEEDDDQVTRRTESNSSPRSANDDLTPEQRHEKKVYYIAREIMTSERVFVDILRLLNVEFRDYVQRARRESKNGIISDADFSRIFSNLPELQALNEDLLQDFEDRIENWHALKKIADVIVRKGPFLKLYTTYIREFSAVNYHLDECCQKYPKFGKLLKEFEKKERCRSLKLKHFMLKPVQRLPQYKLLLEDYLKHIDQKNSPDFDDTTNALRIVSEAAEHANDTIKQGDKFRKMLKLQSRLGDTELIRPGRELIREGELQKISRKGVGPRYFVLLSDYLLYCTYGGNWSSSNNSEPSLRVTYKIPLTSLQVRAPNSEDYQTEFNITSPVRSCTLRASTLHERNEWLESLNSAIEDHVSRKATFNAAAGGNSALLHNEGGLLMMNPAEAAKIGNSAPVWIPDRRVTMCQHCAVEFNVLVRRHHCRACGKVVCSSCSANKAPLRYREFDSARVCDDCFEFLEKELCHIEALRPRFKKRDASKTPRDRYVPQRLKVSANGDGAQMCGYLKKRLRNSKWKRMWFVLKDRVLYAYKASEDTIAGETSPILGYDLDTLSEKNFELYEGEYAGLVFILSHPGGESLVFCAENDNVCEKWMAALREAIKLDENNPTQASAVQNN